MHLPVNTLLHGGTYRIIRFINRGGFGCTYEAEHVLLEKRVAIKEFFVEDFCNRDETTAHISVGTINKKGLVEKLRRKFIDEAKALCRLQHPGIVSVSDVFEENGTAYYVMEYIEGMSIHDILKKYGPLPEERAVRYICQVASALQYVHDNNRLHLDIKPGNIMIDSDDNPILIDFGASKQYDEVDGESTSTLLGKTRGYAPPEQMSNCVVKFMPATDIYALGATLYKMLTGITPLDANLRNSGEELEPLPANISDATRNAVAAAMQMNKTARPQSLAAFLRLLQGSPTASEEDEETELNETATATAKVIDQQPSKSTPKSKPTPKPKPQHEPKHSFWERYKGVVIGAAVAIGAFTGYWIFNKTTVTSEQGSSQETNITTNQPAIEPTTNDGSKNNDEPANHTAPTKTASTVTTGTLSLGYGTWSGGIKNGKRHGKGRITFSENHRVDKSTSYKANAGDYFEANYDNGSLINGRLYDKDGNLIKTIIP